MKKIFLIITIINALTACTNLDTSPKMNEEEKIKMLWDNSNSDLYEYNLTTKEIELHHDFTYCTSYALVKNFDVNFGDTNSSVSQKLTFSKYSEPEKYDNYITDRDICYKKLGLSKKEITKLTDKIYEQAIKLYKEK